MKLRDVLSVVFAGICCYMFLSWFLILGQRDDIQADMVSGVQVHRQSCQCGYCEEGGE